MRNWRRCCARLGLVAGALFVSLVLLECLLRLFAIAPPDPYGYVGQHQGREHGTFMPDEKIGWRMRPGTAFVWTTGGRTLEYRGDADGFRGDAESAPVRGARTIAVLGDSNAWGYGVTPAETFAALLGVQRSDLRVRNFAMCGFAVDQIWQTLRQCALPARPDLAIVSIVADDFDRSLHAYRQTEGFAKPVFARTADGLRPLDAADRPSALALWLDENSHVWTAGKRLLQRIGFHLHVGEWWHLNAALLDAMIADCAAAQVPLVFVWIPEDAGMTTFPSLAQYMQQRGATFVDPWQTPCDEAPAERFFDRHLTVAGHRWVAAALQPVVDRLLPVAR